MTFRLNFSERKNSGINSQYALRAFVHLAFFCLILGKIVCLSAQLVQKRNARTRKVLKLLLQHPVLN